MSLLFKAILLPLDAKRRAWRKVQSRSGPCALGAIRRSARLVLAIGPAVLLNACDPTVPCRQHVLGGDSGVPESEPIRLRATACLNGQCSEEVTVDSTMPTAGIAGALLSIGGDFTATTTPVADWMRAGTWHFLATIDVADQPTDTARVTLEVHDEIADRPLVTLRASGPGDDDFDDEEGSCLIATVRLSP